VPLLAWRRDLGSRRSSPLCQGKPYVGLSDRPTAALRRRTLLEGAVLAARAMWLSEMVASPPARLGDVSYCRCGAPGRNVRHRSHSTVGSLSSARPCHLLALCRLSRCMSSGALVWATSVSVVVLYAALVVTRSRGFARHPRGVGLGVLVVGVEGVCCKPKGWCGVVAIRWHSLQT
jgi:hypothetical protein